MKQDESDSAPEAHATSTLDDQVLCVVSGGMIQVSYEPYPNVGESPYAYMERLADYCWRSTWQ